MYFLSRKRKSQASGFGEDSLAEETLGELLDCEMHSHLCLSAVAFSFQLCCQKQLKWSRFWVHVVAHPRKLRPWFMLIALWRCDGASLYCYIQNVISHWNCQIHVFSFLFPVKFYSVCPLTHRLFEWDSNCLKWYTMLSHLLPCDL